MNTFILSVSLVISSAIVTWSNCRFNHIQMPVLLVVLFSKNLSNELLLSKRKMLFFAITNKNSNQMKVETVGNWLKICPRWAQDCSELCVSKSFSLILLMFLDPENQSMSIISQIWTCCYYHIVYICNRLFVSDTNSWSCLSYD